MKKCPWCGSDMNIDFMGNSIWWQCRKERTHLMSLDEQSDLDHGRRNREEIVKAMKKRQKDLQAKLDEIKS